MRRHALWTGGCCCSWPASIAAWLPRCSTLGLGTTSVSRVSFSSTSAIMNSSEPGGEASAAVAAAKASQTVDALQKKLRVRYLLARCPATTIRVSDFYSLCTSASSTPLEFRMSSVQEADAFLNRLHEARVVVRSGDWVHLRPHDVVRDIYQDLGLPPLRTISSSDADALRALEASKDEWERRAESAVEATAVWRRRFWSAAAVGSGAQMAILSYFTFVASDWDTMEPVCYFVTCATSLVFYAYFLYFRREQSLAQVDENVIPPRLELRCQAAGAEPRQYARIVDELQLLQAASAVPGSLAPAGEHAQDWLARELRG